LTKKKRTVGKIWLWNVHNLSGEKKVSTITKIKSPTYARRENRKRRSAEKKLKEIV